MNKLFILPLVLPILILSMPGCNYSQENGNIQPQPENTPPLPLESPQAESLPVSPSEIPSGAPTLPIEVHLSMSDAPLLNKPVQLTATFTIRNYWKRDAPNAIATMELPDGFKLVEGDLQWTGDIVRGKPVEITAMVMSVQTGEWQIDARVSYSLAEGTKRSLGYGMLYTSISKDTAVVSDKPIQPEGIPGVEPAEPPKEPPAKPPAGEGDIAPEPSLQP